MLLGFVEVGVVSAPQLVVFQHLKEKGMEMEMEWCPYREEGENFHPMS